MTRFAFRFGLRAKFLRSFLRQLNRHCWLVEHRRLVLDRRAASAGVNELSVWNLKSETGGLLRPSSPSLTVSARLRSGISELAFSPSGDRLFVEGSLGCVNLAAGELETLSGEHDGRIWFLSFPGNGQRLATASADGTARLWDVRIRSPEPRIWTNGFST